MRNHEKKQKGESREDFAKRISKLPILSSNTILRAVFPTVRLDTLRYIKDCARSEFPKVFPPEDSNGIPFIDPEYISTKAFAKWAAEENIIETLRSLGEKPSPITELFIELVNGKPIDSKQIPTKVSLRTPHPDTKRAKKNRLRKDYISAAAEMFIKIPELKWPDFKDSPKLKNLLRESGLPYKESTLQRNWIPKARTKAKVTGKPGAPNKKKPTS